MTLRITKDSVTTGTVLDQNRAVELLLRNSKPPEILRTQKAKGISFLEQNRTAANAFGFTIPDHYVYDLSSSNYLSKLPPAFPIFVRPCPIVPRHGFVDSRVCINLEQLLTVFEETEKVEPDAEIILVKPVNAIYNAIIANNVITLVSGNDGATSGKNCSFLYLNDNP